MRFGERMTAWVQGGHRDDELAFLPAALEIIETPASPLARAVAATIAAVFCTALAWVWFGHVDIIAVARGKIIPTGRSKVIQPLESGIVRAIQVHDGDHVSVGQLLVEFDRTVTTAERNHIAIDLLQAQLDAARLRALRNGLSEGVMPATFMPPAEAPDYDVARTRALMISQAKQQQAKLAAFDQQIAQKRAEAESLAATIEKLQAGLPLVEQTAEVRRKAMEIKYGNVIAHLDAQLKLTDQRHEIVIQQHHFTEVAAARQALERQREQAQAEYTQGIVSDLAEAEQKVADLAQDLVRAEKKMQDQFLYAPVDGTVQQLAIHTVGGVVTPAQQLMVIVPTEGRLEAEAMVQNRDIGFVEPGQTAEIKIDTFNFTKYGLLHGAVINVSHDAIVHEKPGEKAGSAISRAALFDTSEPPGQELVYAAHISIDRTQMRVEDKLVNLTPGMAVTVEIKTGRRRIIEYLLSPVMRYHHESLRER